MKYTQLLLSLILILNFGACSPLDRPETNNEMLVVINEKSPSQMRWYIPSAQMISVDITNQTGETQTLSILEPTGITESGAPLFSVQIPPGESVSATFTAPVAAGEYDIISIGETTNNRLSAEIVVVQP
jgi:hypothetical protein